jgi:hypothetical protein
MPTIKVELTGPVRDRIERLEYAVNTMAAWLVSAQTGFGLNDAQGIWKILDGTTPLPPREDEVAGESR